jgi:hypothetical protein
MGRIEYGETGDGWRPADREDVKYTVVGGLEKDEIHLEEWSSRMEESWSFGEGETEEKL